MKLTIITINKNNAFGLEKTCFSVVNQIFNNFEWIIIDGASDDNSVEVIKRYSKNITYWISEPDTGIYNAMNKGINKAIGEYCLFLNSGDWLISPTTLQDLFNEINYTYPADIYYSDRIDCNGTRVNYPKNLTLNYLITYGINHQNSLIKRSLFFSHGFYNESLRIISDVEFFFIEFWEHKSVFVHLNTCISVFDVFGIGSQNSKDQQKERLIVFNNVFKELSEIILESIIYRKSIYRDLTLNYSFSLPLLFILLRIYRFIMKNIKIISSKIRFIPNYFTKK